MSLLTVGELRARVESTLSDEELQAAIDAVEAELTAALGAAYTGVAISETVEGGGVDLFLKRAVGSISSLTEYTLLESSTGSALTNGTDYYTWPKRGQLRRLPSGRAWGARVVVSYIPEDDSKQWKSAIIDLVRIDLARTPMQSESVAGETSYTSPDNWEAERRKVKRRLGFREI